MSLLAVVGRSLAGWHDGTKNIAARKLSWIENYDNYKNSLDRLIVDLFGPMSIELLAPKRKLYKLGHTFLASLLMHLTVIVDNFGLTRVIVVRMNEIASESLIDKSTLILWGRAIRSR